MFSTRLTYLDLINTYSEDYILHIYDLPIGINTHSPVREKDDTPSFRIRQRPNNRHSWIDFGYKGPHPPKDIFTLLKLIEERENNKALSDNEVVCLINKRIKEGTVNYKTYIPKGKTTASSAAVIYGLKYREYELTYFETNFLFTEAFLLENNYYPCRQLYFNEQVLWKSTEKKPTYVYIEDPESNVFQAYRPYNPKGQKHFSWNTNRLILGKKELKHNIYMLFVKSVKDYLVLTWLGYQCVFYAGEKIIPTIEETKEFKIIFKYLLYYGDNDETGLSVIEQYKILGFHAFCNPIDKPKDPSDWAMIDKYEPLIKFLKTEIDEFIERLERSS